MYMYCYLTDVVDDRTKGDLRHSLRFSLSPCAGVMEYIFVSLLGRKDINYIVINYDIVAITWDNCRLIGTNSSLAIAWRYTYRKQVSPVDHSVIRVAAFVLQRISLSRSKREINWPMSINFCLYRWTVDFQGNSYFQFQFDENRNRWHIFLLSIILVIKIFIFTNTDAYIIIS